MECHEGPLVERLVEGRGQTAAGAFQDHLVHAAYRGSHVVTDGLLVRGGVTQLGEVAGEDPVGDPLAVHQNAVVVEDHQVVAHARSL